MRSFPEYALFFKVRTVLLLAAPIDRDILVSGSSEESNLNSARTYRVPKKIVVGIGVTQSSDHRAERVRVKNKVRVRPPCLLVKITTQGVLAV